MPNDSETNTSADRTNMVKVRLEAAGIVGLVLLCNSMTSTTV